jgi:hypothetical protein
MMRKSSAMTLFATACAAAAAASIGIGGSRAAEAQARTDMPADHLLFTTSMHCIACHSNIHAPDGEDISIGWQWRATIMANSARDPYWQAGIRRETMDHPFAKADIEDTCSTCHMPMQRYQAHAEGLKGEVFRYLDSIHAGVANVEPEASLEKAADPKATLAADGVSCTVCHQIRPDNFGQASSFDGGFIVDAKTPPEQRQIFGPFDLDPGRTRLMHSVTGFTPTRADYLREAELCAGCHTLFTRSFDDQGRPAGSLPEQVPYQEWLHSAYKDSNTCQSCHMPRVATDVPITSVHGQTHPDVSRHIFVGGNAFLLRILKDHANELGVIAPADQLEASATMTEQLLATKTGGLSIRTPRVADGRLDFDVTVSNLSGHKLPTAYPARRVWLHVIVRDAKGAVVFESGAARPDGSIAGNDNDADALKFEPHYTRITSPDQVQIYESIMGDYAGRVTTGLLFATHYLKDNRLLPRGFDKATAPDEVRVVGEAANDADFVGGSDTVTYSVPLSRTNDGPYAVNVELDYESIGYRWAQNLRNYDAPEPKRFVGYYEQSAGQAAKPIARATASTN